MYFKKNVHYNKQQTIFFFVVYGHYLNIEFCYFTKILALDPVYSFIGSTLLVFAILKIQLLSVTLVNIEWENFAIQYKEFYKANSFQAQTKQIFFK